MTLMLYIIKWFNPGDNKMIKMKEVKSNYFGNLELEFPILDRAMPMVTFKVYPENVNVF